MTDELCPSEWMAREELITEKRDSSGHKWRKVYYGGGEHFQNWLEQFQEVYGKDNVEVEEIDPTGGPACFERSGEMVYRIWGRVRE